MELGHQRLFDEIRIAAQHDLCYLALFAALVLPDTCAAMSSPDGLATGDRYVAWFEKYIARKYDVQGHPAFTGEDCYQLRCSLLHQGSTEQLKAGHRRVKPRYQWYVFVLGKGLDNNSIETIDIGSGPQPGILQLSIPLFCNRIVEGATQWLSEVEGTTDFKRNFERFMQFRPGGRPPLIGGAVIC